MNDSINNSYISEYEKYARKQHDKYNRRIITGKIVGNNNCVGYCKYDGHPGFLTAALREEHECDKKGCYYYIPKPKYEKQPSYKDINNIEDEIIATARTITKSYEGMKIINVSLATKQNCVIKYVTLSNTYPIKEIEADISRAFGLTVQMVQIKCDYETSAQLIFSK